jgi:ATP-dependent exoDNAse (exonuclease V) beta subunit
VHPTATEQADKAARARIESALDECVFVEAGAGTGKTAALVERVLALVASGVPLREIAAITFTEAAASELRNRIREQLERRVRDTGDDRERVLCERALGEADGAAIGTLHSFAQRLLSEAPIEVGLPPRIEVLDEVSSLLEFDERFLAFLNRLLDDPRNTELLRAALVVGVRLDPEYTQLRKIALALGQSYDRLRSTPEESGVHSLASPPRESLIRALEGMLAAPAGCRAPNLDKLAHALDEKRPEAERMLAVARTGSDAELLEIVASFAPWKLGNKGSQGNWEDLDAARASVTAVNDEVERVREGVVDEVLTALSAELATFTLEAADERRRAGRLEFHDLLVLAQRLLRTSPAARRTLAERYTHLLLDESQDTDPIQIELAVLLACTIDGVVSESWADVPLDDRRLFFVGDPKQSIYRFRRASVELFLEASERFGGDDPTKLTRNFRSVPGVLSWVNAVFAEIMDGSNEGQAPYEPLFAERVESPDGDHRVVLLGKAAPEGEKRTAAELRAAEAAEVARGVVEILRHPSDWPVFDPHTGEWRAPAADDIAILVPARTSLPALRAELDRRRVPYRLETGSLVYSTQEVRDLLTSVRAIADPTDALSLVAALRSAAFACGDDDLFTFAQAGGRFDLLAPVPGALAGDHPVVQAVTYLRELHDRRWYLEPSALVDTLLRERRFFEMALTQARPRDTWRRLRLVLEQARMFAENQRGDLLDFLRWVDLQSSDVSRVHEPALPEPDDVAVRVMTIHGAKGLEFPITFVSGLTTRPANAGRGARVHIDEEGIAHVSMSKKLATREFNRFAELEDEMDEYEKERLLYVAATRARDYLLLAAHHSDSKCFARTIREKSVDEIGVTCRELEPHADADEPLPVRVPAESGTDDADDADGRAWRARRAEVLHRSGEPLTVSPTKLAHAPDDSNSAGLGEDGDAPEQQFASVPRGRAATAIGRATHGVLQAIDLAGGEGLEQLVDAQCALEAIVTDRDVVERCVRSALAAPIVAEAARSEHWRETYVGAPVGGRVVEGYIDLLFRRPEGLVVVDYKTDAVGSAAAIESRMAAYQRQGAAYAAALESATGAPVVECAFVFAHLPEPFEARIQDLPTLVEQLRSELA